jgi:hypothetical protein
MHVELPVAASSAHIGIVLSHGGAVASGPAQAGSDGCFARAAPLFTTLPPAAARGRETIMGMAASASGGSAPARAANGEGCIVMSAIASRSPLASATHLLAAQKAVLTRPCALAGAFLHHPPCGDPRTVRVAVLAARRHRPPDATVGAA